MRKSRDDAWSHGALMKLTGVSLEGSALEIDHGANGDYYGAPGIGASDIFAGKKCIPLLAA